MSGCDAFALAEVLQLLAHLLDGRSLDLSHSLGAESGAVRDLL